MVKSVKSFKCSDVLVYIDEQTTRTVVPKQVVPVVLRIHHDLPLVGHRDFEKTYHTITSRYFWLKMHSDVKKYCTSSGSPTSRQARPVSNDINLDLVLFSQLLLGVRSSSPVVGNSGESRDSSDTDDDLTVNSVEEDVGASDDHEIENESNSDDGNEEENRDQSFVERKQACPVCQKTFLSVNPYR